MSKSHQLLVLEPLVELKFKGLALAVMSSYICVHIVGHCLSYFISFLGTTATNSLVLASSLTNILPSLTKIHPSPKPATITIVNFPDDSSTARTIATTMVHPKLDFCNSLYCKLRKSQLWCQDVSPTSRFTDRMFP